MSRRIQWFHAAADSITITAPFDCVIELDFWASAQWGFGGETVKFGVTSGGLATEYEITGCLYAGNTVGRTAHAKRVVSGAKKGVSYTFHLTYASGTFGSSVSLPHLEAKCYPV